MKRMKLMLRFEAHLPALSFTPSTIIVSLTNIPLNSLENVIKPFRILSKSTLSSGLFIFFQMASLPMSIFTDTQSA